MKIRTLCAIGFCVGALASALSLHGQAPQTGKKPYQPTGQEGTISGVVRLVGDPPAARVIDMGADMVCVQTNPNLLTEDIVSNNGALTNVLVYIKSGSPLDGLVFETPGVPVILEQKGCRFEPHVIGIQTNQTVEVRNADLTTHNIHATPKNNPDWNQSQPPGAQPLTLSFARSEIAVPIKSNQHPWMRAYVAVLEHPFFAVTDAYGAFSIAGLPTGNYTIAAWHERFGEKTIEVIVSPGLRQDVTFSFDVKDRIGSP